MSRRALSRYAASALACLVEQTVKIQVTSSALVKGANRFHAAFTIRGFLVLRGDMLERLAAAQRAEFRLMVAHVAAHGIRSCFGVLAQRPSCPIPAVPRKSAIRDRHAQSAAARAFQGPGCAPARRTRPAFADACGPPMDVRLWPAGNPVVTETNSRS